MTLFTALHTMGSNAIYFDNWTVPIGFGYKAVNYQILVTRKGEIKEVKKEKRMALVPNGVYSTARAKEPLPFLGADVVKYLDRRNEEAYSAFIELLTALCDSEYTTDEYRIILKLIIEMDVGKKLVDEFGAKSNETFGFWVDNGEGIYREPCANATFVKNYPNFLINQTAIMYPNVPRVYDFISGEKGMQLLKYPRINGLKKIISSKDASHTTYAGRYYSANDSCSLTMESNMVIENALANVLKNAVHYEKSKRKGDESSYYLIAFSTQNGFDIPVPFLDLDGFCTSYGYEGEEKVEKMKEKLNLYIDNRKNRDAWVIALLGGNSPGRMQILGYHEIQNIPRAISGIYHWYQIDEERKNRCGVNSVAKYISDDLREQFEYEFAMLRSVMMDTDVPRYCREKLREKATEEYITEGRCKYLYMMNREKITNTADYIAGETLALFVRIEEKIKYRQTEKWPFLNENDVWNDFWKNESALEKSILEANADAEEKLETATFTDNASDPLNKVVIEYFRGEIRNHTTTLTEMGFFDTSKHNKAVIILGFQNETEMLRKRKEKEL